VPFDQEDANGIIYVWIGNNADPDEARITEEIAREMYDIVSDLNCIYRCTHYLPILFWPKGAVQSANPQRR